MSGSATATQAFVIEVSEVVAVREDRRDVVHQGLAGQMARPSLNARAP